jgi:hypothetical protein
MKKMKKLLLLLLIVSNYTFGQFSESFEGTGTPVGWTIINGGGALTWASVDLSASEAIQAQNGTKCFSITYEASAHNDFFITPQFTVTAGVSNRLTFWARSRDPLYPETISVKASTTTATAAAMTTVLVASIAPPSGALFVKYTVDLTPIIGQSVYIGFQSTTTDQFIFDLDNVVVSGVPSCAEPTSPLTVSNVTGVSATVSWSAATPVPASGYDFVVSTSGTAPTAATVVTQTVTNGTTVSLTGLMPSTKYYAYVRSKCSGVSSSVWGQLSIFKTVSPPIVPPYSYGFDNQPGGFVADGWSGTGTAASTWSTNFAVGNPQAGLGLIFSNNASTASPTPANRWMFTPAMQLQANSVNTLTFFIRCLGAAPLPPQNLRLTVGSSATIAAQTTMVYNSTTLANPAWTQITTSFTPTATGIYNFAFNHISADVQPTAMTLALDTFVITSVLSNEQFATSELSIFPNPTKDILNIKMDGSNTINAIQIVDLNGRQILSRTFDDVPNAQIDVNNLSAGMYLINITSGDKSITKKFLKQ